MRQEQNQSLEKILQFEELPFGMEQLTGPEHTFVYANGVLYSFQVDGIHREQRIGKCSRDDLKSRIEKFLKTPEVFDWYQEAFEINAPEKPELVMNIAVINLRQQRKLTARYRVWGFRPLPEQLFDKYNAKHTCGFITYHSEAFKQEFAGDEYLVITADDIGVMCEVDGADGKHTSDVIRKFHAENSSPSYTRELLRLYFGVNRDFSNKFDFEFVQKCKKDPAYLLDFEKQFLRREKL